MPTNPTTAELREMLRKCDAAAVEPLSHRDTPVSIRHVSDNQLRAMYIMSRADAELIAAAVNALPWLLDAADERDRLRGDFSRAPRLAAEGREAVTDDVESAESFAQRMHQLYPYAFARCIEARDRLIAAAAAKRERERMLAFLNARMQTAAIGRDRAEQEQRWEWYEFRVAEVELLKTLIADANALPDEEPQP